MARRTARPKPTREIDLLALTRTCPECGGPLWAAYKTRRTAITLDGTVRLGLQVRRCRNRGCPRFGMPWRPEQEGRIVLPQHEFGLDVIAAIGRLRHAEHRSLPEIHAELTRRGVPICVRSVGNLLDRYDELLALAPSDVARLRRLTSPAGRVILALDGLQPDVGHEVLWALRDVLSGEVKDALEVPIAGVISDGQHSIRKAVAGALPGVPHQLCQFHVIQDINKLILDAVRRMRTAMGRRGRAGRKKRRGRKGAKAKAAAKRRGLTVKEKAHFVFKHRHLIVKRRENLTEAERGDLKRALEYPPALAVLRRFADRIYWVFDTPKDLHQASCRRSVLVRDPAFQAVPELVKAMVQLGDEKFAKLMAYLANPISRRVRTNNHVERANRMFRFLEKVRYEWRGRRTLVRFVVLTLDRIWREWTLAETASVEAPDRAGSAKSQTQSRQRSSSAA